MMPCFRDRTAAGRLLAAKLAAYADRPATIVLALPRGGVPVGVALAEALRLPLDVMLVRKLGVPGHEEWAMGAVALPDIAVFNENVLSATEVTPEQLSAIMAQERQELQRRNDHYRQGRPPPVLTGRTVILVDDGIATGAAIRAALSATVQQKPARVVIAAPVAPPEIVTALKPLADEIVVLETPVPFLAVGQAYQDFMQVEDAEVLALLAGARRTQGG